MVQGKTYTSNLSKLLKHLDVLQGMQNNKISPIMVHMALTNVCNLNCSFCCFANRKRDEILTFDQITTALDSFRKLGTKALEFTGGGEPTLHPQIDEAVSYSYDIGYKIGICTNGKTLRRIKDWNKLEWVRIGLYFDDQNYDVDIEYLKRFNVDVGGAYIFNASNDEEDAEKVKRIIDFSVDKRL